MSDLMDRITVNPEQCGGRPCIRGMRIRVVDILDLFAAWISGHFAVNAVAVRDLGLRDATDQQIFSAAKREDVIVMTKDSDCVLLLHRDGPPPRIIWVRCGNTSNARLKEILESTLARALELLDSGERLVELNAI